MATLSFVEKKKLEDLLQMGDGYVLNFSDRTFAMFFYSHNINIDDQKYHFPHGSSKAKRMRAFWDKESDTTVGRVLDEMFQLVDQSRITSDHRVIVDRLLGRKANTAEGTEKGFLERDFNLVNLELLKLGPELKPVLDARINEIRNCVNGKAWLSAVLLSGSTLEGILLDLSGKYPREFNQSLSAPKDEDGKVKKFHLWTLSELIDVAHERELIGLDVKKFSHALREFRNFIHPYQQAVMRFSPDEDTAKISWQVLKAALNDLAKKR